MPFADPHSPAAKASKARRDARYQQTAGGKASMQRYTDSEKGRATRARGRARRVFSGDIYVGTVRSIKTASILNEAVRKENHARKQQSRA